MTTARIPSGKLPRGVCLGCLHGTWAPQPEPKPTWHTQAVRFDRCRSCGEWCEATALTKGVCAGCLRSAKEGSLK